ncbi:MAG: hypothetical protein H0T57_05640 [Rubrobacter sp.]|nr:hypothetical protein [Rubrobacter sp.]
MNTTNPIRHAGIDVSRGRLEQARSELVFLEDTGRYGHRRRHRRDGSQSVPRTRR